jgi:hypothetical protein
MVKWPDSANPVLLRTDFSDDAAWGSLCELAQAPNEESFQANVDCVNDRSFDGMAVKQVVDLAQKGSSHSFAFLADRLTMTDHERPVLVVDLSQEPGRTFRVIPGQMWGVENNLSLANMEFSEFADNVDPDGVFRGFPKS